MTIFSKSTKTVWRKIKRIWFLRSHWDSGPNAYASPSRCSEDIVTVSDETIDILKWLVYDLWVYHQGFCLGIYDFQYTLMIISWLLGKLFFIFCDLRLTIITIDQTMKSVLWAQLIFAIFIPPYIEPSSNILIFLLIMIDLFLKAIKASIKSKEQFFRVKKVNWFITMIMLSPVSIFEMLS